MLHFVESTGGQVGGVVAALVAVVALVAAGYGISRLVRLAPAARDLRPFLSGGEPGEHAVSRYHVRWYAVTMLFLAFDMEMVFMYPWTLVVAEIGTAAVVEMFLFLTLLFAGVWYAWREGALRWT
ncbi:NADH-quinone oxidoreductase subunit A [Amycolatopsis alkalitolerans]|uniref:NADH-quinone oxidoreductase subunit n=1 Tax=Amycolatopsis alkalitolerans TaxID=2547244 RepID=A0A5C4M4G7_9PSEU|nr:NADH-quinone oxidoreductase subunit A [Amycolatopsis alkalitolerans]TNC26484.1 NADH-quinone oxidoreductase subunit A [Amycolatopsis alkalitolerans]